MQVSFNQSKKKITYKILSLFIAFVFAVNYVVPPAYAQGVMNLPIPGTMITPSTGYVPTLLKGIKVDPINPLYFDFIVDTGDSEIEGESLKEEANKLVKYFLATLTTPEDKLWVNLSPYEQNRMIPEQFGQTEMGRDLLAQDYILKQLTASLMYPEKELGSEFWKRVYKRAQDEFGVKEIPMNTFNKVWIVPSKAVVYQKGTMAYVTDSYLEVMLEEDYTALTNNTTLLTDQQRTSEVSQLTSNVIREIIIPEIEKEVNEGETFASLRQIYHSVILATWFKENLKESLLGQVYVNKGKTYGVDVDDPQVNEKIYQQYLEAFKVGVYDYIKEEYDPVQKDFVARKYVSGGTHMGDFTLQVVDQAQLSIDENTAQYLIGVNLGAKQAGLDAAMLAGLFGGKRDNEESTQQAELPVIKIDPNGDVSAQIIEAWYEDSLTAIAGYIVDYIENGENLDFTYLAAIAGALGQLDNEGYIDDQINNNRKKTQYDELGWYESDEKFSLKTTKRILYEQRLIKPLTRLVYHHATAARVLELQVDNPTEEKERNENIVRDTAEVKQILADENARADSAMLAGEKFKGDALEPVYYFGDYAPDINDKLPRGNVNMKRELGGKGTGLYVMSDIKDEDYQDFLQELLQAENEQYLIERGINPDLLREHAANLSINVPIGYTIATEQTKIWNQNKRKISIERGKAYFESLKRLEEATGLKLGDPKLEPLLVAIRSGAAESMPGMMDTILNLGMNDESVKSLAETSGNARFAWDAYRRFFEMFARTVLKIVEDEEAETGLAAILEKMVHEKGVKDETELEAEDYQELVALYKEEVARQGLRTTFLNPDTWEYETIEGIPQNPYHQYFAAVETVMRSTFNDRAFSYRKQSGLALEDTVSAVNVVKMIYGNKNDKSGTGVAFTRDVQTGENKFMSEFAFRAQGEDVVAGRKEGMSVEIMRERAPVEALSIQTIGLFLERYYSDVQDMEYTFEHNVVTEMTKFFMLQTRNAKRSLAAAIRTAVEMVEEGLITEEQAVARVDAREIEQLLASRANAEEIKQFIAEGKLLSSEGLNAAPGLGVGHIVISAARAEEINKRIMDIRNRVSRGEVVSGQDKEFAKYDVILMRDETSPEDLDGMLASDAIYTARGGRTSHAAVVARQFGIPAVVGDKNLRIDFQNKTATFNAGEENEAVLNELDVISVDGTGEKGSGRIFIGALEKKPSIVSTAQDIEGSEKVDQISGKIIKIIESLKGKSDPKSMALVEQYEQHLRELSKHYKENSSPGVLSDEEWSFYGQYKKFMEWVDDVRRDAGLGMGANAERPLDIHSAILNGAERVGLARTEHMFSGGGRELMFQRMIFAENEAQRREVLKDLLTVQQVDFEMMYLFLEGRPITIRLLDPPLHEFLPREEDKIAELAEALDISVADVRAKITEVSEENPMFGTRGVRLSILYPEIIEMQANAILQAKQKVNSLGVEANPEIMVPLIGNVQEYKFVKSRILKVSEELGIAPEDFKIGTMQEIIAFAANAGEIAEEAEFFSAGTNDYTQGTYKFSREDGGEYLAMALLTGVFPADPFVSITPEVAEMLYRVYKKAYAVNKNVKFKCGMCGEQGVDIESIEMALAALNKVGLDYVSGGARRLPGARLVASQEVLKGIEQYEGKEIRSLNFARNEVERMDSIANAQTLTEQFKAAHEYITKEGNKSSAIRIAIGNLDLSKPVTIPVEEDENAQYIISLSRGLKSMNVELSMDINQADVDTTKSGAIGLVTLEHYFSQQADRELIDIRSKIQEYLLTTDSSKRETMLETIKELIRHDLFSNIGRALNGQEQLSVRLPNIALQHTFKYEEKQEQERAFKSLASRLGVDTEEVERRVARYEENNPAIGQRGSRVFFLSVAPLYTAITQAVVEAVADSKNMKHLDVILPFIVNANEIRNIREGFVDGEGNQLMGSLDEAIAESLSGKDSKLKVSIGSNIETPSAAIGTEAIGTALDKDGNGTIIIHNRRLTEAVWAAFEGDAREGFLQAYLKNGIWENDPFTITPPESIVFIEEALADLRVQRPDREISMITNPGDKEAILLAQAAGVQTLIVEANQVGLAQIAAAQANILVEKDAAMTSGERAHQIARLERIAPQAGRRFWRDEVRGSLRRVLEHGNGFDGEQVYELLNLDSVVEGWEDTTWVNSEGESYPVRFAHARVVHRYGANGGRGGTRYVTPKDLDTTLFRDEFNRFLDASPTKELVEQFILSWIRNMASDLAIDMTFKNYANETGYGGAKSVVFIGKIVETIDDKGEITYSLEDYEEQWKQMNPINVARVARSHAQAMIQKGKVGIGIDHPAADVKTGPEILSYYADEYFRLLVEEGLEGEINQQDPVLFKKLKKANNAKHKREYEENPAITPLLKVAVDHWLEGNPVPWLGVFNSKPAELGGISGRTQATGIGVVDIAEAHFETHLKESLEGKRVNIQGFGNVGSHAALEFARRGAKITAIGDVNILITNEKGFTVDELQKIIDNMNKNKFVLSEVTLSKVIDNDAEFVVTRGLDTAKIADHLFHDQKADILVPAAVGGVITERNEEGIKEGVVIIPGANGAVTVDANTYLNRRDIIVISPTLASALGVIMSGIESEANQSGIQITEQEAVEKAREVLLRTYQQAYELKRTTKPAISMDTALKILAMTNFFSIKNTTDRLLKMTSEEIVERAKEFPLQDLFEVVKEIEGRVEVESDDLVLQGYKIFLDNTMRLTFAEYKSLDQSNEYAEEVAIAREVIQRTVEKVILKTATIKKDSAMTANTTKGGIDLNPQLMGLEIIRDDSGMPLPVLEQPLFQMNIDGFVPVIINVTPITNLPLLLGLQTTDTEEDIAYLDSDPMDRKARFEQEEIGQLSYLY